VLRTLFSRARTPAATPSSRSNYAEATPWLKDSLDWAAFDKAGLGDEAVWLPFFFAL
jgi:hypothetical protein